MGISIREIADYKQRNPNVRIVHRVNECDARKGLVNDVDPILRYTSQFSDCSIFISQWLLDYHARMGWFCDRRHVILNGSDLFKDFDCERSESSKIRLVTHHWSNNEMKGFDVYEEIDRWIKGREDVTFKYIGRDRGTFKNTEVVGPCWGKELAQALRDNDVYVSASRWDPGPNHIAESIAACLPTYVHPQGGGAVEMAGADHVYDSTDALLDVIEKRLFVPNCNGMSKTTLTAQVELYYDIIDGLFR